jgi:hypothetical protein
MADRTTKAFDYLIANPLPPVLRRQSPSLFPQAQVAAAVVASAVAAVGKLEAD